MAYAAHIVDLLAGMLLQGEFDVEKAALHHVLRPGISGAARMTPSHPQSRLRTEA